MKPSVEDALAACGRDRCTLHEGRDGAAVAIRAAWAPGYCCWRSSRIYYNGTTTMITTTNEIVNVLDTFTMPEFAPVIALARSIVATKEAVVSKTGPFRRVRCGILIRFAPQYPDLPTILARECVRIVEIADLFALEEWYLFLVRHGVSSVAIYANEQGVGRFCHDLSEPRTSG